MGIPYVGEIRMFAGNFAPAGWMFCEGQTLAISEYEALFQLIGTTYGGDGQAVFNLPNLAGRVPIHTGIGPSGVHYRMGDTGGTERVTLTVPQMPRHTHPLVATSANGVSANPAGMTLAASGSSLQPYIEESPSLTMSGQAVSTVGSSQPHENLQPFLCVNFIISLFGIFPSQT